MKDKPKLYANAYSFGHLTLILSLHYLVKSRSCRVAIGHYSNPCTINRGIVQGSAVGPQLYIVMKSDLRPLSSDNILVKYADDIILLVPENSTVDRTQLLTLLQNFAILKRGP